MSIVINTEQQKKNKSSENVLLMCCVSWKIVSAMPQIIVMKIFSEKKNTKESNKTTSMQEIN